MIRQPPACPNGCDIHPISAGAGVHTCPDCGTTWRRDQITRMGQR